MTTKAKKTETKFDFRIIKSFEDACAHLGVDPQKLPDVSMIPEDLRKPVIAAYKLMIVFRAINNGWIPDWSNHNQYKYYPWLPVLSSGFGFSSTNYTCDFSHSTVGSRLCTDSYEKALYIAKQFETEYKEYFLYSEQ